MSFSTLLFGKGALLSLGVSLVAIGGYIEDGWHEAQRLRYVQASSSRNIEMHPAPIPQEWIIEGKPTTEMYDVAKTFDGSTRIFIWRTSAAKFKWVYDSDEVVTILDGEVYVTDSDGHERHLKPGDVALFPDGASTVWRVPHHVLKSGTLKHSLPRSLDTAIRWMRTMKGWLVRAPAQPI